MTTYMIHIIATVEAETEDEAERAMLTMCPWPALDAAGVELHQATVERK